MAGVVPEPGRSLSPGVWADLLGEALDALPELAGATAGWVGLAARRGEGSGLTFPVCRGQVPPAWLELQQGQARFWGFTLHEDVTLLNDLPGSAALGEPPLKNV